MLSGEPCLRYRCIQDLVSIREGSPINPDIAFCTLHIYQHHSDRDPLTKEVDDSEHSESLVNKDMVKEIFNATIDEWEKSKQWQDLLEALQATDLSNVKQIVAFACGTMEDEPELKRQDRRSMYQHSLLLTLRKFLQGKQSLGDPPSIQIWVQDPEYCAIDTSILAESEVSTLDDPDGFLKVDDSTMVLSFAPNIAIKQIITDICRPAAIIWYRVEEKVVENDFMEGKLR
jgi:hypothetical protein